MTQDQRERFDELLMHEAQRKGGLSVVDIMILKEAFFSCEIERPTNVKVESEKEPKDTSVC